MFCLTLIIELLAANPCVCLDDFSALLKNSALTREAEGKSCQFPFRLCMSKENVSQLIMVDKDGFHVNGKLLRIIPARLAFRPLCEAMGISEYEQTIKCAHSQLSNGPNGSAERSISIDELLKALAAIAAQHHSISPASLNSLYQKAIFAFESQTQNPLLQSWENVIAGMAESTESGFIKPKIIDSIMFALERKLCSEGRTEAITCIADDIKHALQSRIQLQFDPLISHNRDDDDGNSSQGAFVLYDTGNVFSPNQWIRVDDPDKFQKFISAASLNPYKDLMRVKK